MFDRFTLCKDKLCEIRFRSSVVYYTIVGTVHMTGYQVEDESPFDDLMENMSDEEEDEEGT